MARIRSYKPEFWTDAKILECSPNARLLFLGLLTFADDQGNIEAGAKSIKAKIFPCDNLIIPPLLSDLCKNKLLNPYEVNGERYFNIQGFAKHQKIDKPGKPRCPFYDHSTNAPREFDEPSPPEGKGGEGKGREGNTQSDKPDDADFEILWQRYKGEKDGKKLARGYFNANIKTPKDLADYDKAEQNYYAIVEDVRSNGFPDRRLKNAKTWFNNWRDYIDQEPPKVETLDPRDDPGDSLYEPNRNGASND